MFILDAKIYKSGKHWLAEIPELDAMTQGKSKKDAQRMLVDWVRSSLDDSSFDVIIHQKVNGQFVMVADSTPELIGLFLQRQRLKAGLTIRQIAIRLGFKSHNAYAQYEQGRREASLSMLEKLMSVLNSKKTLNLKF
jgi:hypothetical protein